MLRIATTVSVTKNTKVWDAMKARLMRAQPKEIQVGIWGTMHPSGIRAAQIMAWNEEGHVNGGMFSGTITPARPAIRMGYMPQAKAYVQSILPNMHLVATGKLSWNKLTASMGPDLLKIMQDTIWKWDKPRNSPVTVKLKGFNNPLIDTGFTMSAIKYRIVQKRRVGR